VRSGEAAEGGQAVESGAAAVAVNGFDEGVVTAENVVVLQWGRLIGRDAGVVDRHGASLSRRPAQEDPEGVDRRRV
jgi:hypothetical protein